MTTDDPRTFADLVAEMLALADVLPDDDRDWMLATQALMHLPIRGGVAGLRRFAEAHPGMLRVRRHPRHRRRWQVSAADVFRLVRELERASSSGKFPELPPSPAPISEAGYLRLADAIKSDRARKRR